MFFLSKNKIRFIYVFIISIVTGFIVPATLLVLANIINILTDVIERTRDFNELFLPVFFYAGLLFLPTCLQLIKRRQLMYLENSANNEWLSTMNEVTKNMSYIDIEDQSVFDSLKICFNNNRYSIIINLLLNSVSTIVSIVSLMLIFLQYSWWYPVIILFFVPIVCMFSEKIASKQQDKIYEVENIRRKTDNKSFVLRSREYSKEVRLFNASDFMLNDWYNEQKKVDNQYFKIDMKFGLASTALSKIKYMPIFINLILTAYLFILGLFDIGMFIAVSNQIITFSIYDSLSSIFAGIGQIKSLDRKLLDVLSKIEKVEHEHAFDSIVSIKFDNVTFSYHGSHKAILTNLSFSIGAGEKVLIVGENGAGKSTIIKLMSGLYLPDKGQVLINGICTRTLNNQQRAEIFGVVFQDFTQYSLTLRENLLMGFEQHEKFDYFGVDKIAEKLSNGFETLLGREYGESIDLSGGEWQRVALSRIFCMDKSVLIFDEPTASLDPIAEVDIFKQILKYSDKKITIIVTHRLGFSDSADKLLFIQDGTLKEYGTFRNLIINNGGFAHMYNLQKELYIKRVDSNE